MSLVLLIIFAFVSGLCLLLVGPMLMGGRMEALALLLVLVTQLFPLRGIASFAAASHHRNRLSLTAFVLLLAELLSMIALVLLPYFSTKTFIVLLELYLSFTVTVKAVGTFLYAKQGQWSQFVPSVVVWVAGTQLFWFILFGDPQQKEGAVFFTCGFLLTVFGTGQLCDFISLVTRNRRVKGVLSNIRLALPDITGLLVPLRTAELLPEETLCSTEADPTGQVEVLFQVSAKGIALAGHCELCVDGETYTYGAYDPDSARLFHTLGDGILFRAPREEYLTWCMEHERKKIISYTLKLNGEQETALRKQLAAFEEELVPWEPTLSPRAYASQVQKLGNVRFYRVTKGRFRTYFIPTINCVSLTDHLLEKAGIGHAVIMGIKTPGAYMDHLERLYLTDKGTVTGRRVYTKAVREKGAEEENYERKK